MQDVCLSIWPEGDTPDMLIEVTDICSIDPSDPSYCASPYDIKMDRAKVQILYGIPGDGSSDPALQPTGRPIFQRWILAPFKMLGQRKFSSFLSSTPSSPMRLLSSTLLTRMMESRHYPNPPTKTTGSPSPPSQTISTGTSTPPRRRCRAINNHTLA